MAQKMFKLPEADVMRERLTAFNPSADKLNEMLIKHADTKCTPHGFVMMYALATADYTQGLPRVMVAVTEIATHQYARHLIDDPDALAETLSIIGAMGLPNT